MKHSAHEITGLPFPDNVASLIHQFNSQSDISAPAFPAAATSSWDHLQKTQTLQEQIRILFANAIQEGCPKSVLEDFITCYGLNDCFLKPLFFCVYATAYLASGNMPNKKNKATWLAIAKQAFYLHGEEEYIIIRLTIGNATLKQSNLLPPLRQQIISEQIHQITYMPDPYQTLKYFDERSKMRELLQKTLPYFVPHIPTQSLSKNIFLSGQNEKQENLNKLIEQFNKKIALYTLRQNEIPHIRTAKQELSDAFKEIFYSFALSLYVLEKTP